MIERRRLGILVGALSLAAPNLARAAWPDRPIRWVGPWAPGGAADVIMRLIAEPLAQELGQPIVIDNRPGAGTNIGIDFAAHSPPDGYTWVSCAVSVCINAALYKSLPYNFLRDLAPVAPIYCIPNMLSVGGASPFHSVSELIAYAKAHPGELNYGSQGNGTTPHLSGVLFAQAAGIDLTHVPYRSATMAQQDLIAGRVQIYFDNLPLAAPQIRAGQTRALAVTMEERSPLFPDVPTMREAGVPLEILVWTGVFMPTGVPQDLLTRLNTAIGKVLSAEPLALRLRELGNISMNPDRAAFAAYVAAETERWATVVRASGASID